MSLQLLTSKLYIPPIRPERVSRPHLIERLNAGLRAGHKLTLVSAPAGFGKTTLLSEWIHSRASSREYGVRDEHELAGEVPVTPYSLLPTPRFAWLSLDEGDNDLARFLTYVVAALQTVAGNVGQALLTVLQSPGPINVEAVLTTLLNEIAGLPDAPSAELRQAQADRPGQCLVLVLDDYHVIESQAVDKTLTFTLDHMPPRLHLVIATRTDPTLPLSRLRARGQLTELRQADLRFTTDEAAAFLKQVLGLPISPGDVRALENRTEGWITGLQLAAVAMQGLEGPDQIARFIHSFSGSHRYVIDYLVDEVLDQQTPSLQAFLLQTSILDRMVAPLCNAVTDREDSQALLERLEAANLFLIPLDGERRWYRYHHLFAELLRQRLQQSPPSIPPTGGDAPQGLGGREETSSPPAAGREETSSPPAGGKEGGSVATLHLRASAWYEKNGLEVEAFRHAAAANDFERAARLVEGDGNPLYHRGAITPVLNWLASLPSGLLGANPSLRVMYAEVLTTRGRLADSEAAYQAAEAALEDAEQDPSTRDLLGRIANGRASLASFQGQPERMMALARRALELLHPDNLAIRGAASLNLGYAYQLRGDRDAASQAFAEAITNGQSGGNTIVTTLATERLGGIQAAENRLRQAAQTYQRALQLAGERPLPYIGDAHLGLARIRYEWNDLDAARRHAQQGLRLLRQIEHREKSIACEVFLARLKLAHGDMAGATAILDVAQRSAQQHQVTACMPQIAAAQVRVSLQQGDLTTAAHLAQTHDLPISQARVHLAQGGAAAALAVLEPARQQMEARDWQDNVLKLMVLQAVALYQFGKQDQALQLLVEALALTEPEGFIRTFVDEGVPMAQLLSAAAARGMMKDYTNRLLAAFEDTTKDERRRTKDKASSSVAQSGPSSLIEPLSPRELEVLQLIAQGLSNREIGERLFLALDTIKGHNRRIYGKLQVQRRTEAVARARELGLL